MDKSSDGADTKLSAETNKSETAIVDLTIVRSDQNKKHGKQRKGNVSLHIFISVVVRRNIHSEYIELDISLNRRYKYLRKELSLIFECFHLKFICS